MPEAERGPTRPRVWMVEGGAALAADVVVSKNQGPLTKTPNGRALVITNKGFPISRNSHIGDAGQQC